MELQVFASANRKLQFVAELLVSHDPHPSSKLDPIKSTMKQLKTEDDTFHGRGAPSACKYRNILHHYDKLGEVQDGFV